MNPATVLANLFDIPATDRADEIFDDLLSSDNVRIQRIVSHGQSSPPDFWHDQDRHEWVIVLSGSARIGYENGDTVHLEPGDYLSIPAHTRHRLEWTPPNVDTVWLAVFYR